MSVLRAVRRRAPVILTALVAVAIAAPLGALAAHQFADVPDSNLYHNDIDALVDSGVTTGCGGGNYCPSANVTREQMAAFLNRLGALAPGKTPVVNADKLDGIDSTGFLAAGNIQTYHGGPWIERGYTDGIISNYESMTRVTRASAGEEFVLLHLTPPSLVGSQAYGFLSATVCTTIANQANGIVDGIGVFSGNNGSGATVVNDTANRALGTCNTVTNATPTAAVDPLVIRLDLEYYQSTYIEISEVRVVWTPVG